MMNTATQMQENLYARHGSQLQRISAQTSAFTRMSLAELLVVTAYPLTVLTGQLLSVLSQPLENYYTNKHNLLNVLFVKRGWAWTLILVSYFMFQHYGFNAKVCVRVLAGTAWWVIFTQWFFGLPLMDRVFVLTGGDCVAEVDVELGIVVSSVLCRKMKGSWSGGHDPSGHVFLLVLSSLILWFELIEKRVLLRDTHKLIEDFHKLRSKKFGYLKLFLIIAKSSTIMVLCLLALWWWMLLVTSTHFHSFLEKLTGLFAAYIGLLVYLAPRFL